MKVLIYALICLMCSIFLWLCPHRLAPALVLGYQRFVRQKRGSRRGVE